MAWYDFLYQIFTDSFHASYEKGTHRKNALLALYNLTDQFKQLFDWDLVIKSIKEEEKEVGKVIGYLLLLDGIAFVVLGILFFLIASSLVIYIPVVNTNTITLNTITGAGTITVFPIYYLFGIVIAALDLALFNPFFLFLTRNYKVNQKDRKKVKDEKLLHLNYFGYQISKKFYPTVALFPIALSVLFTIMILPSGLTIYQTAALFVVPIIILLLFATYLHQRIQTDLYEDNLFKLKRFKINISVVTKQKDIVSGTIESIGSFLILKNGKGLHAIKWIDVDRISHS